MNALYRLPQSQHRAGLAHARPHLSLVRSAAAENHRTDADHSRAIGGQAAQGAGRLGSAWAQRAGLARAGEGVDTARTDWPGRAAGIRAPEQDETPLSADEVMVAARIGLCSSSRATTPPQRVFVARGDWAIDSAGATCARWFDAVVTA